ncbi:hypothetical protein K505DRAFT_9248 [Melanomma pulvis-pyrius CBS 109.77]|uniref:Uncharacterized protein n=1 Tax=Melanomma pulvis-pyrius CBS 109.77 TaxID=1314802 RepID=A0A6A6WNM6_9PLEO|nr:hypothetical protein K505DRAFT_9248 [Melanomma pulvis-pyrius CBS 109.77]
MSKERGVPPRGFGDKNHKRDSLKHLSNAHQVVIPAAKAAQKRCTSKGCTRRGICKQHHIQHLDGCCSWSRMGIVNTKKRQNRMRDMMPVIVTFGVSKRAGTP